MLGFNPETPTMSTPLTELLAHQIQARHCPGALALVERDGRTLARHCVGRLQPEGDAPMHEGARFRIASLTKPVVSVALLMLADEGRVNLDAPVGEYLPVLRGLALAGGQAPRAAPTLRDLLRHTSGLAYPNEIPQAALRERWLQDSPAPGMAGVDAAGFLAHLTRLPLVAEPGTVFRYGYSTDVLGCVIEAMEGAPLASVLQRRLFGPLAMQHTSFEIGADELTQVPRAYADDAAWHAVVAPIAQRRAGQAWMDSGGGGLVSTLDDYANFARLLAHGGVVNGQRLLSEAACAAMLQNQLPDGVDGPGAYCGPGFGFGLGLAVRHGWGPAAMACSAGEGVWSGISGTAMFVQPRERWFALLFSANMASRMLQRMAFRRAVGQLSG